MFLLFLVGCVSPQEKAAREQQRYASAKALFDQTTKLYHLPSAQAQGTERDNLLAQAAGGYQRLLQQFPDQPHWCAQALRSLGNIRAAQGKLDDAVKLYARVGSDYPREDWEVLQAWKSAADLLWDAGRQDEARAFYRKIVERFDTSDSSAVVKTIVKASRARLGSSSG